MVQACQQRAAVVLLAHRVAQRCVEALQQRGMQQEFAQRLRQVVDHLFGQVGGDAGRAAGEVRHFLAPLRVAVHPQRRQVQRHRPALGALAQLAHGLRRQARAEQGAGFLVIQRQVVGQQPFQVAVHRKARQRQRGAAPGRQQQVQARAGMFDQPGQQFVDGMPAHAVVVVEDDDQPPRRAADGGGQRTQGQRQVHVLPALHQRLQCRGRFGAGMAERLRQVGDEAARIAVVLVQRQPACAHVDALAQALVPLRQQRGLAESRWRQHHRQRQLHRPVEPVQQCIARDGGDALGRGLELAAEHPLGRQAIARGR